MTDHSTFATVTLEQFVGGLRLVSQSGDLIYDRYLDPTPLWAAGMPALSWRI